MLGRWMTRRTGRGALLAAMVLDLGGCGAVHRGGIVDNGEKPQTPGDGTSPGGSTTPTGGTGGALSVSPATVLGIYLVDLPETWQATSTADQTILSSGAASITFVAGGSPCNVAATQNPAGTKIYACSPTKTALEVGEAFVSATHSPRTEEMDGIFASFRAGTGSIK